MSKNIPPSTEITHTNNATGSVIRTLYDKLQDTVSVKDFGAVGDGVADDTAAIQSAINAARALKLPLKVNAGRYNTTSSLTITSVDWFIGDGKDSSFIQYSGSSSAIICSGWSGKVAALSIYVSNAAANAIEIGTASRNCSIQDCYFDATAVGSTQTGAGIFLNAGAGFSGGLLINNCYAIQFKFGCKFVGTHLSTGTWTSVTGINNWFAGYSAAVIAGSSGIYLDALSNGIGNYFTGGTIESYAIGIQHIAGGYGGVFEIDMEANTLNYQTGNTFTGRIVSAFGVPKLERASNGAALASPWFQWSLVGGYGVIEESYYGSKYLTYEGASTSETGWYRGSSIIDGNPYLPNARKFVVGMGQTGTYGPDVHPDFHYIEVGGRRLSWGSAPPTTAGVPCTAGDTRFQLTFTGTQTDSWSCQISGTLGVLNGGATTANCTAASPVITVSSSTGMALWQYVSIAGGVSTAKIIGISGTTITLSANAGVTSAAAAVSFPAPRWIANKSYGTFTLAAATSTTVANVNIYYTYSVILTPVNAAAALLMGSSKSLFVSSRVLNTSFTVNTADGTAAAGTEQFAYMIIN